MQLVAFSLLLSAVPWSSAFGFVFHGLHRGPSAALFKLACGVEHACGNFSAQLVIPTHPTPAAGAAAEDDDEAGAGAWAGAGAGAGVKARVGVGCPAGNFNCGAADEERPRMTATSSSNCAADSRHSA